MNDAEPGMPTGLRSRVFADLRPVRPLREPWKRALVLAPLGLLLLAVVHARYGTRADLGALLVWGLSLLQMAVGVGIAAAVLRDVIPGRALPAPARALLFAAGFALAIIVTYLAWYASGTTVPAPLRYRYWSICFRGTIELGLPALVAILLLATRGMMWRPGLAGGLAGLAAGLIADASWRTFCDVAEPSHVLAAHIAAIVALAVIGAGAAKMYAWLAGVR